MPCYAPLKLKDTSGSRAPQTVPCGGCIGCRMDKAADWSIRIAHEGSLYEANSFLTLTYDDEHLPDDYSVRLDVHQRFMKRLRKEISPTIVRFFACGEYGENNFRPHYHYIIFNYGFPDKTLWRKSPTGFPLYRSPQLEGLWTYGHSEIGTVTAASGGYVARYCLKKVSGPPAADHYQRLNPVTGEICLVQPEFAVMSKKPGLGSKWFDRFERDCFPSDFVIIDGKKKPIPRFYSKKLEGRFLNPSSYNDEVFPKDDLHAVKQKRKKHAKENHENSTKERLAVREELAHLRADRLSRSLGE